MERKPTRMVLKYVIEKMMLRYHVLPPGVAVKFKQVKRKREKSINGQCRCTNSSPSPVIRCFVSRVPVGSSSISSSSPLPPAAPPAVVPVAEPYSNSWVNAAGDSSRLSSDEGDPESPDDSDRPSLHYSSHHPRPLGVNI